jgi:hypothetical protein
MPRLTSRRLSNWPFLLTILALTAPSSHAATPYRSSLPAFERVLTGGYRTSPWLFPTAAILRANAHNSIPRDWRDSISLLRTQTLQAAYAPPARTRWTYVRVRKDSAEAVNHNYAYAAWRSHDSILWAKVYATRHYVMIWPASLPHAGPLQSLVASPPAWAVKQGIPPTPPRETEAMLQALWAHFLRQALPPAQNRPSLANQRCPYTFGLQAILDVAWPGGEENVRDTYQLRTDGCFCALQAGLQHGRYGRLMDRVWGSLASPPAVHPLNPRLIRYQGVLRYVGKATDDDFLAPTNRPTGRCQIQIAATDALLRSGWWWNGVPLRLAKAQIFTVDAPGGRVPEALWQACEFADLTTCALEATQPSLADGHHARCVRFDREYAGIRVPANASALHARACRVIRAELASTPGTRARTDLSETREDVKTAIAEYCRRSYGNGPPMYDS